MVSSYVRLRCSLEEAMARYGRWIGLPELGPARLVAERDAVDLASPDGDWLGLAVLIYASGPWTVIEELSGGLALRPPESWLELAQGDDLVYAGYNDAIPYAQVLMVQGSSLTRQYLQDEQDPSEDVDVGRLPDLESAAFGGWIEAMAWVEADQEKLDRPRQGWLWIHLNSPEIGDG